MLFGALALHLQQFTVLAITNCRLGRTENSPDHTKDHSANAEQDTYDAGTATGESMTRGEECNTKQGHEKSKYEKPPVSESLLWKIVICRANHFVGEGMPAGLSAGRASPAYAGAEIGGTGEPKGTAGVVHVWVS
jgi:hypothetical protein